MNVFHAEGYDEEKTSGQLEPSGKKQDGMVSPNVIAEVERTPNLGPRVNELLARMEEGEIQVTGNQLIDALMDDLMDHMGRPRGTSSTGPK